MTTKIFQKNSSTKLFHAIWPPSFFHHIFPHNLYNHFFIHFFLQPTSSTQLYHQMFPNYFPQKTYIKNVLKKISQVSQYILHTSFPHNFSTQFLHPFSVPFQHFSPNRPLGRFGLVVAMSVYEYICLYPPNAIFFQASYWPSDHSQFKASHW